MDDYKNTYLFLLRLLRKLTSVRIVRYVNHNILSK